MNISPGILLHLAFYYLVSLHQNVVKGEKNLKLQVLLPEVTCLRDKSLEAPVAVFQDPKLK